MTQEDVKNLVGWLQVIYKELQETRGITADLRTKSAALQEIHNFISQERKDNNEIDQKIDDTRTHIEARIGRLEQQINDLKNTLEDIRSKVNHLK